MAEHAAQTVARRGRLYEIDAIRAVTAICVVGVHAVTFTVILTHTNAGQLAQNAVVSALHFTREIFIAITAFVMVYGYVNRPFHAKTFWRKRGLGVLLPYVLWSLFYEVASKPPLPAGQWSVRAISDILSGVASFQLYYILLTLEFYLILPWFLRLMTTAGKRPWVLLGVSFALQAVMLALDYQFVQTGPFSTTPIGVFINQNQSRFLLLYQFYAVLGGVAALYMPQVRAFVLRHGRLVVAGFALGLALLWGNLWLQTAVWHKSIGYGISVFQPAMVIYAIGIAAFLYWLATRWATRRAPQPPRGAGFWALLSNASFGVYLIHAYILEQAMVYLVPNLPTLLPEPLRVALTWALVAGVTVAICVAFLYTPLLSRLIGHPCMLSREQGLRRWLANATRAGGHMGQSLARVLRSPNAREAEPAVRSATVAEREMVVAQHKEG